MEFLADQDVYAETVRFLSGLGHDVVTAEQLGLAQAEDTELLRVAHEQGRLFVTRGGNPILSGDVLPSRSHVAVDTARIER